MCCKSKGLSRLGVLWGLLALCTLIVAFVSGSWLYTKEPIVLPKTELTTSISFRIGLWRVCPSLKRINSSIHMPAPACSLVKYAGWEDVKADDLGLWAQLDLAPVFIARMRICTVLSGAAVGLLLLGFFFSLLGHCIGDNKTLIASGLYILGALLLGTGLMAFASVLSETVTEATAYRKESLTGPEYDYRYGWCFFTAGAAFIMSKMAAVFSLSGYLNRFASVDEMVRIMVPGAERKLREHHRLTNEYMERHQRHRHLHHMSSSVPRPQYDPLCTKEHHTIKYEPECGPLLNKTPPDVCTTNKCMEFAGVGCGVEIDCAPICMESTMQSSPCALAGQTVPIQIKTNHHGHTMLPQCGDGASSPGGHLLFAGNLPPPPNFSNPISKYGTLPNQGFVGVPAAELSNTGNTSNYSSKANTLQHPRARKKCVKIETFHTPETGFADFTLKRSTGPAAAMNYSGSAV